MGTRNSRTGRCDALDAAALWPSSAQICGMPIPQLVPERTQDSVMEEAYEYGVR